MKDLICLGATILLLKKEPVIQVHTRLPVMVCIHYPANLIALEYSWMLLLAICMDCTRTQALFHPLSMVLLRMSVLAH
jgi:hypothetical protein